ncbi:MAG: bifunctional heptose 7-phosphate kinase/heptose 1-phosphate adenyltransferase [Verrucomicrobiales bacterium]
MTDTETLLASLPRLRDRRVLVLGDVMLDIYDFCSFAESKPIDSEKPGKRAYTAHESTRTLGGAANVATNLASLGARATLVGLTGDDGYAHTVRGLCEDAGLAHDLISASSRPTTTKTRIYIDGEYLLRKDHEDARAVDSATTAGVVAAMKKHIAAGTDAVVLSDYAKGIFTEESARQVLDLCAQAGVPVVVDFKPVNRALFQGAGLLVPNETEASALLPSFRQSTDLAGSVAELRNSLGSAAVVVTLGARGLCGLSDATGFFHHPGHPVTAVDAVGCGDTVRAMLALGLAGGLNLRLAAALANHAAAVIVQKAVTATLNPEELEQFIRKSEEKVQSS